jgi:hypothetical protein
VRIKKNPELRDEMLTDGAKVPPMKTTKKQIRRQPKREHNSHVGVIQQSHGHGSSSSSSFYFLSFWFQPRFTSAVNPNIFRVSISDALFKSAEWKICISVTI